MYPCNTPSLSLCNELFLLNKIKDFNLRIKTVIAFFFHWFNDQRNMISTHSCVNKRKPYRAIDKAFFHGYKKTQAQAAWVLSKALLLLFNNFYSVRTVILAISTMNISLKARIVGTNITEHL